MKKEDLKLSQNENRNSFLVRCLPIEEWHKSMPAYEETLNILNKAQTSEEVIDMILNSDTMRWTQIYAELSKDDRSGHWKRILRDLDGWYETWSDAGGLKIGMPGFTVIVPNGYGDGKMRFTDVGKGCFNESMLNFWTSVEGHEINIYDYDCGDGEIVKTLDGRYGVFYGYGFIVFERWGDAA